MNESNKKSQNKMFELESELSQRRREVAELQNSESLTQHPKITELQGQLDQARQSLNSATANLSKAQSERDDLRQKLASAEASAPFELSNGGLASSLAPKSDPLPVPISGERLPEASDVMGKRIAKDDFKIIEGIGPKIEQLLFEAGISTWKKLSETSTSNLKDILTKGGDHFSLHTPTSWPSQALLAEKGRWKELKSLQNQLERGKKPRAAT